MIIDDNNNRTNKVFTENTVHVPRRKEGISYSQDRWYKNKYAKSTLVTAASAFYGFILTIFSLVYELFQLVFNNSNDAFEVVPLEDVIFGSFMYGVSIWFLLYCYYDLYIQFRTFPVKQKIGIMLRLKGLKDEPKIITHIQGVSRIPGFQGILNTGSLILKFGCIVFASLGLAYYVFVIYYCFRENECTNYDTIIYFLPIIFIILQTHYIFCNWKIKHTNSYTIGRFGTMHLVATNLWTWFRFVFFEQSMMSLELSHALSIHSTVPALTNTPTLEIQTSTYLIETNIGHVMQNSNHQVECYGVECNSTLVGFMYTSMVEYSLIGAAVMFIVWDDMKHLDHRKTYREHRKEHRKINFNNISYGILLGLLFLASSVVVLAIYKILDEKNAELSAITFSAVDLAQNIITICACLLALHVMRILSFVNKPKQDEEEESQELLEIIMLIIGLIGEMIFSVGGLFGIIITNNWDRLAVIITLSHAFTIIQVSLQSVLIYIGRKLRIEDDSQISKHPGKQTITFLLIANISMMIMDLHESENFGISPIVVTFYGSSNWGYLIRSFAPLTIFYRFHSSVCLADIWANTYSRKINDEHRINSIEI